MNTPTLEDIKEWYVLKILSENEYRVSTAADILKISNRTVRMYVSRFIEQGILPKDLLRYKLKGKVKGTLPTEYPFPSNKERLNYMDNKRASAKGYR